MNNQITTLIITQQDLLEAGCFNVPEVIRIVHEVLEEYNINDLFFPDKISMIFDEKSQNRINILPAGFKNRGIFGCKYVSVFPVNPKEYQRPTLSAVNILSELETGFPIAFMEGTMESNLRTAAVGAIAAKYLSNADVDVIGFIGAGEQAKTHFMTMKCVRPSIQVCKVASRTIESELTFINQLEKLYPDVTFVSCKGNCKEAVCDADIIVTAISGQEQILKAEWIKKGAFYCHVAGIEDEYDVALKASKIVVDSWDAVKHRTQTISQMYKEGILTDDSIYGDLYEIVQKLKAGRERSDEFIYFNSVGLSFIDTAVSYWMYQCVLNKGFGKKICMSSNSMFEADQEHIILN